MPEPRSEPDGRLRAAVMVAHPGHELMIHHWIERHRPMYCVLTDGSGGSGRSRTASTARVIEGVGATIGPIFGRYPDRELYRLLLQGRVEVFVGLVDELTEALLQAEVDCIAGDPVEGFNPVHDVNRFIINGAVTKVRCRSGRTIQNYDFALDGAPGQCPASLRDQAIWLRLDDDGIDRKLTAAHEYPELREEVRIALERFGRGAFAVECLRPANRRAVIERFAVEAPLYERSGEMRVDQGVYDDVIRYRQHVLPVLTAIQEASCR
jgi:hypothetical protein